MKNKISKGIAAGLTGAIVCSLCVSVSPILAAKSSNEPGWKKDTSPITFTWLHPFGWMDPTWWGKNAVSKYVTKKTGVTIKGITTNANFDEKISTIIASGDLPDFITLENTRDMAKKLNANPAYVYDLESLAKKYDNSFFSVTDSDVRAAWRQNDGHLYSYPNFAHGREDLKKYPKGAPIDIGMLARKDMYEALGKPDMSTPAGFLKALEAAQKKFPKVGGKKLLPFAITAPNNDGSTSTLNELMTCMNLPSETKDFKIASKYAKYTDPEMLRWYKMFSKAFREGLIDKEVFIDNSDQLSSNVLNGRVFCILGQESNWGNANIERYRKDPKSAYIAIKAPRNSYGAQARYSAGDPGGWCLTFITKKCKKPERAIRFMDYMMSPEGQLDLDMGEKGVTYDIVKGKPTLKPQVIKDKTAKDYNLKWGVGYYTMPLSNDFIYSTWKEPNPNSVQINEFLAKDYRFINSEVYNDSLLDPASDTPAGVLNQKMYTLWCKTWPSFLMAKSDKEVDSLAAKFRKDIKAIDPKGTVDKERQKNLNDLKKKFNWTKADSLPFTTYK